MGKEIFVDTLNLNPNNIGGFKEWISEKNGFKKPVIFKTAYGPMGRVRPKTYKLPFSIPEEAIGRVHHDNKTVFYVKAPSDVRGINLADTVYMNELMQGTEASAQQWKKKYEDLLDEYKALKKELALYREEEAEKEKHDTGDDQKQRYIKCQNCERQSAERKWEDNDLLCPKCNVGEQV